MPRKKFNVLPFVKGEKAAEDTNAPLPAGDVVAKDLINNYNVEVTKYDTVHIYRGGSNLIFKKSVDDFEKALDKLKLDSLSIGERVIIAGSGDNDDLVFTRTEDDIKISLERKGYAAIEKIKRLLKKRKKS